MGLFDTSFLMDSTFGGGIDLGASMSPNISSSMAIGMNTPTPVMDTIWGQPLNTGATAVSQPTQLVNPVSWWDSFTKPITNTAGYVWNSFASGVGQGLGNMGQSLVNVMANKGNQVKKVIDQGTQKIIYWDKPQTGTTPPVVTSPVGSVLGGFIPQSTAGKITEGTILIIGGIILAAVLLMRK